MSDQHEEVGVEVPPLTPAEYLDLRRLVENLLILMHEQAQIPKHSGSSTPLVRRQHRIRRRELEGEMNVLRGQIVNWAIAYIPIYGQPRPPRRIEGKLDIADPGEEVMWQCEGCGALWPLSIDSCDGSWVHDDFEEEGEGPTHEMMYRPERST